MTKSHKHNFQQTYSKQALTLYTVDANKAKNDHLRNSKLEHSVSEGVGLGAALLGTGEDWG